MDLTSLLTGLNETLTACVVFPAMILLGLYLTYRLRFVQVTKLKAGFTHLLKQEKDAEGSISHFEAISLFWLVILGQVTFRGWLLL